MAKKKYLLFEAINSDDTPHSKVKKKKEKK